jgi:hypothetical protein
VKLYLDGKIRQWYSRGDGKGVIFLVDAKTEDEARAVMETLPLAKEHLMDHEYIPVGPLMPLRALMGPGAQQRVSSRLEGNDHDQDTLPANRYDRHHRPTGSGDAGGRSRARSEYLTCD